MQPQVGPSLGPNNRRPGRAQREPRPTTRHEAKRLHFVTRCLASGTRKLGRIHHSAHDFKQPTSFPRRISAPGVCNFASPTRIEGWAERRETFGCVRSTRWACHLASKTRVNALMTRHARRLRGALRPMTRDARLSALHRGDFGPRGRASVSLGARRPTTAGSCLRIRAASSSQPGRSAWRATSRASRGERLRAACRRTPLPAPPSGTSPETPHDERGCESCSMNSIRSQ